MSTADLLSWVDGVAAGQVPVTDRGLQYGDGVFRSMLVWDGQVPRLALQLSTIARDATAIGLPAPNAERLAAEIAHAAQRISRGVLKVLITAGDSARGYARPIAPCPRRILIGSGLPAHAPSCWTHGVAIQTLAWCWHDGGRLNGSKHLNRLEQVLARDRLEGGFQEGSVADAQGMLCSGTMSNIFWWQDEQWHTPPLSAGGIKGTMRQTLLDVLQQLGMPIEFSAIPQQANQPQCQAALVCNAVIGIWPVRQWDQRELPIHPSIYRINELINHSFTGVY